MTPKVTKHKQERVSIKESRQLHQDINGWKVADDAAQDSGPGIAHPKTTITNTKYPLLETWEELGVAEAEKITHKHKNITGWLLPEILPVLVHVAAPQAGRFTREVQSDIDTMNSIEAVKDLVKDSLIFELKRTNIEVSKTRFAGLMVYGPSTEFRRETIKSFTRGLFLQEAAFKKWWLTVNMSHRVPGDMVKIAVVLWHADEAAVKQVTLPNFWTDETTRILGNHLEKLEMPGWDLDIEKGCCNYVQMQQQVLEARARAVEAETKAMKANDLGGVWQKEKGDLETRMKTLEASSHGLEQMVNKLTKSKDDLVHAIEAYDMEEVARLVANWKRSSRRRAKSKTQTSVDAGEASGNEEEIPARHEDVEMADGCDDPKDSDYVEE
ncbi:hypothetical protein AYO20_01470 [Fonsecaea nubica]|uniref:Uncharacterized protein n=1 Tax=Fonsecaea nubica TaxID=856822 RepID=A0A178DBZ0_9EURO|nr:hypothetical protein AYO20_01470 [Fonsecaea nubica]OAL39152.1 hypothetical protein AYO20_01470 [Fonsecaea nubica]